MIYPKDFEKKIGFDEVRTLLIERCQSSLGKEWVEKMAFCSDVEKVNEWLAQIREYRKISESTTPLPLNYLFDVRTAVGRLRLEGTHMEENELFDLKRSLETISDVVEMLCKPDLPYPSLNKLASEIVVLPHIVTSINRIIDRFGKMRDDASPALLRIRRELIKTESGISHTLNHILRMAQNEGLVDKDASPTMRDGRLVIPIAPTLKRRIKGIVHDESASGKTVFVEPSEVVEANNRVRELEAEERREAIRILTEFSRELRPYLPEILSGLRFLGYLDFLRAKSDFAQHTHAVEPVVEGSAHIDWYAAHHPLLRLALERQGKKIVPLNITLTTEKHLLIISGPNAGGKSVCLKTVGLLQYMLQCGMSIPIGERSQTGIFDDIMIDIGDEQSIADDLSTYSGHLLNMKNMMKQASSKTLLLIDEFGGGTEPLIGGAIAESVLNQFCEKHAFGVITTHYQNLKHFADHHTGITNGAMLYDRHEMRPLFQLAMGQPGSSFAIEIARKIGLPERVIKEASEIVGSDYIQSDKFLQDIVRDKRYWENKRQNIHQHEKQLEERIAHYEAEIKELEASRKDIIRKAKAQAEELLKESNKRIESAIKEIREQQAEKAETKRIREELELFKEEVASTDSKNSDEMIDKKIRQLQARKERREKRKKEKEEKNKQKAEGSSPLSLSSKNEGEDKEESLGVGDYVRIKGLTTVGKIETIEGKMCVVIFGDMRTKMRLSRLERAQAPKSTDHPTTINVGSKMTRETIDNRKLNFKQDLDVRGMRGDDAINAVTYFIDDAILVGMSRVRILHGTGTGILRQLIRQYLQTIPNVADFHDEHVQFGGAGITVIDLDN